MIKTTDQEMDDLSLNIQQNFNLNENDKFNDFNYWREPISANFDFDEEILLNSNQCDF